MHDEAMTSSNKKQNAYEAFVRRFDFERDTRTGTLRDLIAELNISHQKKNGEQVTVKALKGTLAFLEQSVGVTINADEEQPISSLKTAKLLFLTNSNHGRHLFRLLAPPVQTGKATMEFSTGTTIPRDKDSFEIINSLAEILSIDIDPEKLKLFSLMLGKKNLHTPAEKLLLHAERTNDEVTRILTSRFIGDDGKLADAYRALSRLMDSTHVRRTSDATTPTTESTFVYLETLAFRHLVLHYPKHLKGTRIKHKIGDIRSEATELCQLIGKDRHPQPNPSDKVFSLNNFHHLVFGWPKEVTSLVRAATGFNTPTRQLKNNTIRAKALLASYGYRSYDSTDPDARILSIYDIVAALCSFRYQQEAGTDYKPYWPGQVDQGKDPQRLFDKGLKNNDPYQHQGVIQIYLNRFYEFQAAFTGTTGSHQAWMQYQVARLDAYLRIIEINDIIAVVTGLRRIDALCLDKAMEIVIDPSVLKQ